MGITPDSCQRLSSALRGRLISSNPLAILRHNHAIDYHDCFIFAMRCVDDDDENFSGVKIRDAGEQS